MYLCIFVYIDLCIMKKDYNSKLGSLAMKLKTEDHKISIQEVNPIKPKLPKEEDGQLNVWIPKHLLKRVKSFGIEKELSLKDIAIKALEQYIT